MEVNDAQTPKTGPDEGTSSYSWTTVQVGGEVRYGTGWPVMEGDTEVGRGVADGVLARLSAPPGSACAEGSRNSNQLQSLWVFSSGACGAYGFADLRKLGPTETACMTRADTAWSGWVSDVMDDVNMTGTVVSVGSEFSNLAAQRHSVRSS
jgi:hypothetical protein